ncbi:MAG: glutamate--tRNA ligase [Elusimicrobia bacterium GWA2_62_23]|nr:MAG: glutamate--tRNA ligase [Elusimicrobia bacterium GWA2_62_23]
MGMNERLADLLFPDVSELPDSIEKKYPARDLPPDAAVTRFAPSPTGFLHIGGVFAALISERLAHQTGGIFYLRIEDTDKKREMAGGVAGIVEAFQRLAFKIDEGPLPAEGEAGSYGPYKQSERGGIYKVFVKELLRRGDAYPCFCSEEDGARTKEMQEKAKVRTGYYGSWATHRNFTFEEIKSELERGKPFVIRLRSRGDIERKVRFRDLIKGDVDLPENDHDIVILKSDGLPTYHFAHIVDDHLMKTTHVIRGDEWLSSIPLHLEMFALMGWKPPSYAHVSPILKQEGASKRKLSKRKDPEAAVSFYHEQGFPSAAVVEYLLNLANSSFEDWRRANPGAAIDEFKFELSRLSPSGALFDIVKLADVSKEVISKMDAATVLRMAAEWASQYDQQLHNLISSDKGYAAAILGIERGTNKQRKDIEKWSDVRNYIEYFFDDIFSAKYFGEFYFPEQVSRSDVKLILERFKDGYLHGDDAVAWMDKIRRLSVDIGFAPDTKTYKKQKDKFKGQVGDVCMVLRVAITGRQKTPDLYECMRVLGPGRVAERIDDCLSFLDGGRTGKRYDISPELLSLAPRFSCRFLDFFTSTKQNVRQLAEDLRSFTLQNGFVISTCLRYEVYSVLPSGVPLEGMFHSSGLDTIRRLLLVMCGLRSEIVGETEILAQIEKGIAAAHERAALSIADYKALNNLLEIAKCIRRDYGVETQENYSTAAWRLMQESLSDPGGSVVLIVGGGYMADAFFRQVAGRVKKVIWANRSVDKLRKAVESRGYAQNGKLHFSPLEDISQFLPQVDGVFLAVGGDRELLKKQDLLTMHRNSVLIDISFPPAAELCGDLKQFQIATFDFTRYIEKQLSGPALFEATRAVNQVVERIADINARIS